MTHPLIGVAVTALVVGSTLAGCAHSGADRAEPVDRSRVERSVQVDPVNPWRRNRTLVIPHAGGDGSFPENTLVAYERSMAMGADVVDVDVRLSGDGIPVVIHDDSVTRTTGAVGKVSAMRLAELQRLDAGYGFTENGTHPFRGKGVTIPTLDAVLRRFPHTMISIDLKDERLAMVKPLCDVLHSHGRTDDVFVGSNGDPVILEFRKRCPDVRTSAVMTDVYALRAARASNDPAFRPIALVDQPPYRRGRSTFVTPEGLAFAHAHHIALLTWVVNDENDMRHLVDMGVDGIYTSYPGRLLRVLAESTRRDRAHGATASP